MSVRRSRDSRIGHHLPTAHTRFAHLESLPDIPLLDIYAILDSHVRVPLAATGTGDTFLGTAPQTEIGSGYGVERNGTHCSPGSGSGADELVLLS